MWVETSTRANTRPGRLNWMAPPAPDRRDAAVLGGNQWRVEIAVGVVHKQRELQNIAPGAAPGAGGSRSPERPRRTRAMRHRLSQPASPKPSRRVRCPGPPRENCSSETKGSCVFWPSTRNTSEVYWVSRWRRCICRLNLLNSPDAPSRLECDVRRRRPDRRRRAPRAAR